MFISQEKGTIKKSVINEKEKILQYTREVTNDGKKMILDRRTKINLKRCFLLFCVTLIRCQGNCKVMKNYMIIKQSIHEFSRLRR